MNKKIFIIITIIIILFAIYYGISKIKNKATIEQESSNQIEEQEIIENINKEDSIIKEREEEIKENKMFIKVNNKILTINLENNSSSEELVEKLKQNDITIKMHDYSNFEKVGDLGFNLTTNDKQITTEPGDVILYQGNKITIYYDINSWNFTKLGHIENITQQQLKDILGSGDVTITLTLKQ